jgi:hypothetical protein
LQRYCSDRRKEGQASLAPCIFKKLCPVF